MALSTLRFYISRIYSSEQRSKLTVYKESNRREVEDRIKGGQERDLAKLCPIVPKPTARKIKIMVNPRAVFYTQDAAQ